LTALTFFVVLLADGLASVHAATALEQIAISWNQLIA
jgi:hypothetical protein